MKEKFGLSGNILKWIGIVTMFIDHVGATLIYKMWLKHPFGNWEQVYWLCRHIGRLGFPLFAFMIVEGFIHTRDWRKYCGRLFLFALISEVPFDLAVGKTWFTMRYMNVIALFALGVLLLGIWRILWEDKPKAALSKEVKSDSGEGLVRKENETLPAASEKDTKLWLRILKRILAVLLFIGAMALAELLNMDYGEHGIAILLVFYLARDYRLIAAFGGCGVLALMGGIEPWAAISIIPILLYNGKRGRQIKYFFYCFYPIHLLVLGFVAKYII